MDKKETVGFYGGKFLPLHKGHLHCIGVAARQCSRVVVVMFINGEEEQRIRARSDDPVLTVAFRMEQLRKAASLYPNVETAVIDTAGLRLPDGSEDWDAETPLVRKLLPRIDFVYSSEPRYGDYFRRAYPEATHVVVDAARSRYPVSGTLIRSMEDGEERRKWII